MRYSFLTVCMDRLCDLRWTLPGNLRVIQQHGFEFEWLLLDWSSSDGLPSWVFTELPSWVEGGFLTYYRSDGHKYYRSNRTRNVLARLASGGVLVNVNADEVLSSLYPEFLQYVFENGEDPQKFIAHQFVVGCQDRWAVTRENYLKLGGRDETMDEGYAGGDTDFTQRAEASGLVPVEIPYPLMYPRRIERGRKFSLRKMERGDLEKELQSWSEGNIEGGCLVANEDTPWGSAIVKRDGRKVIKVGP